MGNFLVKVLSDRSITLDITQNIFVEIIETAPSEIDKKEFGQDILRHCILVHNDNKPTCIIIPDDKVLQDKYDKLLKVLDIFKLR